MDASGQQGTNTREQAEHLEMDQTTPVAQDTAARKRFLLPRTIYVSWFNLEGLRIARKWRAYIGVSLYAITVALLVGGFLYWKFYVNGMVTKSLFVGGYTYSFKFTRAAKYAQYGNGMRGYEVDGAQSTIVGPVGALPQLCGYKGTHYVTAFTVHVYGQTRPVCTAQDSQDEQMYTLSFTALGAYHEFQVTSGYTLNPKDYPKLIKIFESITVSR